MFVYSDKLSGRWHDHFLRLILRKSRPSSITKQIIWQCLKCSRNFPMHWIVRWTRHDVFVHIDSFMKKQTEEWVLINLHVWSFQYEIWPWFSSNLTGIYVWKCHVWSIAGYNTMEIRKDSLRIQGLFIHCNSARSARILNIHTIPKFQNSNRSAPVPCYRSFSCKAKQPPSNFRKGCPIAHESSVNVKQA